MLNHKVDNSGAVRCISYRFINPEIGSGFHMTIKTRLSEAIHPMGDEESQLPLMETVADYSTFLLSPTGYVRTWNHSAQKMNGYTSSEIIGKHYSCFFVKTERQKRKPEEDLQIAQQMGYYEKEAWWTRKDGSKFWANVLLTPLYDNEQKIIGYSKTIRNLSQKKDVEEGFAIIRKDLHDLQFALNQSTIVAFTNNRGVITFVNDAFCRISQYSASELVGKTHKIINSSHHPKEFFHEMWNTIAQGLVWKGEIKNRAKDGSYYWVDTTITPYLDPEHGKPYQYVAIRHDITARKLLEMELANAKEAAEEANRKKSLFLANMSHELRTPLNAVISYSQMMKQGIAGSITEKQYKYANNIEISGKHLLDIVNDILDIAKIEAGKIQLSPKAIPIKHLILDLENILSEFADRQQVHLEFEIDPKLEIITGDPVRLRQIFFNLISNAIKFNSRDGHVTVRVFLDEAGQGFIGEIQDTGIGIPADKLGDLFTEFYQVDDSTSRCHEGTGLGLALTQHLVRLHSGEISVESEAHKGSTFRFRIPIQKNIL